MKKGFSDMLLYWILGILILLVVASFAFPNLITLLDKGYTMITGKSASMVCQTVDDATYDACVGKKVGKDKILIGSDKYLCILKEEKTYCTIDCLCTGQKVI